MPISLYNTLTKQTDEFTPYDAKNVRIYSCGPTVYDHVHIGNLSAFIVADTLRRMLQANDLSVKHVMNFTDVDDKTIRRSRERYSDMEPRAALSKLTGEYSDLFLQDMRAIGNDVNAFTFIRATDEATIDGMKRLIDSLHEQGFAYIADDGVYFSIDAYRKSGKKYGQLVEITDQNTSSERIQNDEYDKDSAHDFALWKIQKPGEPAWEFELSGQNLTGRPGWHIECSVMSHLEIGQPFDIHTGGIDLAFPHHENEIAQSTAGNNDPVYAKFFVHNEHILVDGKKMSKSAQNFYTLNDLIEKGVDPLAFRLLVLQSHYRKPTNFSLDNAEAAHNRLKHWRNVAALRHQTKEQHGEGTQPSLASTGALREKFNNDIDTPSVLSLVDEIFSQVEKTDLENINNDALTELLSVVDDMLGLQLLNTTPDINDDQKLQLVERARARETKDWAKSDNIRDELLQQGIAVRDSAHGQIWEYA